MATPVSTTLAKAFDVLRLFSTQSVLTAGECSALLNIPRSTAHRLLNSLVHVGALSRTNDDHYCLSLFMFELGSLAPLRRWLCDRGRVPLQELSEETGMPSNMAVLDGRGCVLIETVPAPGVRVPTRVGHHAPLHSTSLGKLLLAYASPSQQAELLEDELTAYTPRTTVSREALSQELEKIRESGIAYEFEETHLGTACIAVPIRDRHLGIVAGISVSCSVIRFEQRRPLYEKALRTAQRKIQAGASWQGAL